MAARRRLMESGVRFRPRLGRFDSNAVRYALTVRPMDRPAAMASLCAVDISRFFFGGITPSDHTVTADSNIPFHRLDVLERMVILLEGEPSWRLSHRGGSPWAPDGAPPAGK